MIVPPALRRRASYDASAPVSLADFDDIIRRWRRRLAAPAWSVLEYLWYPALLFLTTPLFLHRLGPSLFGQWSLLTAIAGLGSILNVGTGAATIRQVAAALAGSGRAAAARVIRAGLIPATVGGALAAVLIVTVIGLGASGWLARMGDPKTTLLTAFAAAALLAIDQCDNVFNSGLRGGERFRQIARIEMLTRTTQIGAAAVAVLTIGSLESLYCALIGAAVFRAGLRAWAVRRWLEEPLFPPSRDGLHGVLGDASWGWVQGAGGMAFGIGDRFIVGSTLGAAALAHYSVATQLAQPLHAIIAAATSVIFPKISAAMTRGDTARLRRLLVTALAMLVGVATVGLIVLFVGRHLILQLWLGTAVADISSPALGWLAVAYWLLALAVLPHYVLLGMGRMRFVALTNLLAGLATLAAMIWAARVYGLEGVAAARILYGIGLMANIAPIKALWRQNGQP